MTSSSRKRREEALRRLLDEMAGTTQGRSFFSIEQQVMAHRDRYVFRGDIDLTVDQLLTPAPSSAQKPLWW
jgi:hypothetical protein